MLHLVVMTMAIVVRLTSTIADAHLTLFYYQTYDYTLTSISEVYWCSSPRQLSYIYLSSNRLILSGGHGFQ